MAQPEVARTARLGVRVEAVRPGERLAEIGAVNVVEGIIIIKRVVPARQSLISHSQAPTLSVLWRFIAVPRVQS